MVQMTLRFKAERTGFDVGGLAMYFVQRQGNKPFGSFSGEPGRVANALAV